MVLNSTELAKHSRRGAHRSPMSTKTLVCLVSLLGFLPGCGIPRLRLDPRPQNTSIERTRPVHCTVAVPKTAFSKQRPEDRRGFLWSIPGWFWTHVRYPEHAHEVTRELAEAAGRTCRESGLFAAVSTPCSAVVAQGQAALHLKFECHGGGYDSYHTHYGVGIYSPHLALLGLVLPWDYCTKVDVEVVASLTGPSSGEVLWGPKAFRLRTRLYSIPLWFSARTGRFLSRDMNTEIERVTGEIISELQQRLPPPESEAYAALRPAGVVRKEHNPLGMTPAPSTPIGQRWAVIVGVSEYEHAGKGALRNLRYAARDAKRLYEQLVLGDPAHWPRGNVRLLADREATREAVSDAVLSFLKRAQKDDLVLVFFSGHGSPDPSRRTNNYFLCHDTEPTKLASTGFPMWEIDNALERGIIEARRVVVLADACHSGGFVPEGMKDLQIVSRNVSKGMQALGSGAACRVVTSCEPGEVSRERAEWGDGHGAFAYALVKGISGRADSVKEKNSRGNGDGRIDLDELVHFVRREVGDLTSNGQHVTDSGRLNVSIVHCGHQRE